MTHEEAIAQARELIEQDDQLIYDVAANLGQIVANVKHMAWFRIAIAEEVQDND
jgi:hypothetical protein